MIEYDNSAIGTNELKEIHTRLVELMGERGKGVEVRVGIQNYGDRTVKTDFSITVFYPDYDGMRLFNPRTCEQFGGRDINRVVAGAIEFIKKEYV